MKKKLEADLISIAHRVLQMKNKSDIDQLYIETQKLYEKLSVLRFVEENFGDSKPTIGQAEIIEKIDQISVERPISEIQTEEIQKDIVVENTPVVEEITAEETIEEEVVAEEIATDVIEPIVEEVPEIKLEETTPKEIKESNAGFIPAFELEKKEEDPKKEDKTQISFEDLLGANYNEPLFVKKDHNQEKASPLDFELPKVTNLQQERVEILSEIQSKPKEAEPKPASVIDKPVTGINIGLNDRIAFVKHLFGNSNEDYVRVLNQLITFDSFNEAQDFIENMVKPDYNNWEGKEDYSERFIQIIEKKFA
ncbi:MAG: hypothetical protein V4572_03530 [Bacteroidota bacterium]